MYKHLKMSLLQYEALLYMTEFEQSRSVTNENLVLTFRLYTIAALPLGNELNHSCVASKKEGFDKKGSSSSYVSEYEVRLGSSLLI